MHITIIGSGYVGLVTGACLAELGNHVVCVDIDQNKLQALQQGDIPIHEPGLEDVVKRGIEAGLLQFTGDLAAALQNADACFIAVGTPPNEDGSADLSHVLAAARQIGSVMQRELVVVDKSTVPVGTAEKVRQTIREALAERNLELSFHVVSNPEFLKEGAAVADFMRPDRIIVGTDSPTATALIRELYAPFSRSHDKLQVMGVREAEMTKYAANAILATKISFMNEIANLCERFEVDVEQVRRGIGSDSRIGHHFIYPGAGYGGSCFPKDVKALIRMAHEVDFEPALLSAVEARNQAQKRRMFEKMHDYFRGDLTGRRFAVWGLAFKPNTDDVREASAEVLLGQLVDAGATVFAFDPQAQRTARRFFDPRIFDGQRCNIVDDAWRALEGADAMVLMTEWKLFQQPDFQRMGELLAQPVIFDGRNQYDPHQMAQQGFDYIGIGRSAFGRS